MALTILTRDDIELFSLIIRKTFRTLKLRLARCYYTVRKPFLSIEAAPRSNKVMTYDEAAMYCLFYEYKGKKGWRLPTWDEYQMLFGDVPPTWIVKGGGWEHSPNRQFYVIPVRDKK